MSGNNTEKITLWLDNFKSNKQGESVAMSISNFHAPHQPVKANLGGTPIKLIATL